jgi:hypothetical protein
VAGNAIPVQDWFHLAGEVNPFFFHTNDESQ